MCKGGSVHVEGLQYERKSMKWDKGDLHRLGVPFGDAHRQVRDMRKSRQPKTLSFPRSFDDVRVANQQGLGVTRWPGGGRV